MKIVVAGASGVVGQALIPILIQEGHDVVGFTRNPNIASELKKGGIEPVILDVFNREAVFSALQETKPDAVIHQLTSLSARNFSDNARIRKEGTRNLVDASLAADVGKMIVQSISWAYAPGDGPAAEDSPLDLDAAPPRSTTIEGVRALESAASEMPEHVILRYGLIYGNRTWYAPDGYMAEQARQRLLPATGGISSFVHVDDAALAAAYALSWPSGCYNIVDDEPAAGTDWLPVFADAVGAPQPDVQQGHAAWERGARNGKALRHGWKPRYSSWRDGFRLALGPALSQDSPLN
ncbi:MULTISPECIES: NAD-dependent epimerase/dehydratase family protein [Paenibacillus]|uniref:NAD-dependent epimerase/dehydratase family protein n=1 Tax=Paenibacillus TaxID=44249 RepID=UPI0022B912C9|nr:NAD(P)-dependent oxidoreductase [Paenibacillus caseinilyticus]MCZ8522486.1 NAD(P)-dependent oxidoreductase [Paenibacillus caseinilyticus]